LILTRHEEQTIAIAEENVLLAKELMKEMAMIPIEYLFMLYYCLGVIDYARDKLFEACANLSLCIGMICNAAGNLLAIFIN